MVQVQLGVQRGRRLLHFVWETQFVIGLLFFSDVVTDMGIRIVVGV